MGSRTRSCSLEAEPERIKGNFTSRRPGSLTRGCGSPGKCPKSGPRIPFQQWGSCYYHPDRVMLGHLVSGEHQPVEFSEMMEMLSICTVRRSSHHRLQGGGSALGGEAGRTQGQVRGGRAVGQPVGGPVPLRKGGVGAL